MMEAGVAVAAPMAATAAMAAATERAKPLLRLQVQACHCLKYGLEMRPEMTHRLRFHHPTDHTACFRHHPK